MNERPINKMERSLVNSLPPQSADSPAGTICDSAEEREDRNQRAVRAVAWTGAARYGGQLFRWGSTFFVMRLLTPEDYGLVGMNSLFAGLVALLAEFGVGASVIRMRDLEGDRLAQVNGLAMLVGFASMLVGIASAWPAMWFFGRRELIPIVSVASVNFFISSIQTVPSALLQRRTAFKEMAAIEISGSILLSVLVLAMAFAGAGYWSLVFPTIAVSLFNAIRYRSKAPVSVAFPRLNDIREAYHYSVWIIGGRLSSYLFSCADFFIVGRMLGSSALGGYGMAWDLANTPNDQVNGLVAKVSAPYYSELQNDKPELFRFFLLLLEGVCFLSVPLVIGLASVSPEFVDVVLGSRWAGMTRVLQLLCVLASLRIVSILINPLMAMAGDAKYQARISTVALFLIPPCLALGAHLGGTIGIACAWLVVYPALLLTFMRRTATLFGTQLRQFGNALRPAFVAGGTMALVILVSRPLLGGELSTSVRLFALIAIGAVTYLAVIVLLYRVRVERFVGMIRRSLAG